MFQTQRCLAAFQNAKPDTAQAFMAEANMAGSKNIDGLDPVLRRNAALDAIFYDLSVLSPEEAASIGPWAAPEGAILLVPPCGAGALTVCPTPDAFLDAGGGDVRILSVAGVGSSALGTAAFARNIATAMDQPVAAVVSGYGMADLISEALGGWFWFRTMNGVHRMAEGIERLRSSARGMQGFLEAPASNGARHASDLQTVMRLLQDTRFSFSLMTGHSKGNLVLSEALYKLKETDRSRLQGLAQSMWIVTVSAAIYMPEEFEDRVIDVIGAIDWFGGMNSRPDVKIEKRWPRAWHHTNTEAWYALPVTDVFRELRRDYPIR